MLCVPSKDLDYDKPRCVACRIRDDAVLPVSIFMTNVYLRFSSSSELLSIVIGRRPAGRALRAACGGFRSPLRVFAFGDEPMTRRRRWRTFRQLPRRVSASLQPLSVGGRLSDRDAFWPSVSGSTLLASCRSRPGAGHRNGLYENRRRSRRFAVLHMPNRMVARAKDG